MLNMTYIETLLIQSIQTEHYSDIKNIDITYSFRGVERNLHNEP